MLNISESAATDKHTGCFTAQSKVVLEDGRRINMSQVMVGDMVQSVDSTGNVVYSEVLMFMDREPEERMRFITITGDDGRQVTLTPSHLIFTGKPDCGNLECMEATYAGNVQTGHSIMVTRDGVTVSMTVASTGIRLKKRRSPLQILMHHMDVATRYNQVSCKRIFA